MAECAAVGSCTMAQPSRYASTSSLHENDRDGHVMMIDGSSCWSCMTQGAAALPPAQEFDRVVDHNGGPTLIIVFSPDGWPLCIDVLMLDCREQTKKGQKSLRRYLKCLFGFAALLTRLTIRFFGVLLDGYNCRSQAGSGISVGSSFLSPLTDGNRSQFDRLWEAEVTAEGCGEPASRQIPILFGRSLEVHPVICHLTCKRQPQHSLATR